MRLQEHAVVKIRYCVLPLWHEPLNAFDDPKHHLPKGEDHGYVSTDGCLFPCRCATFICD